MHVGASRPTVYVNNEIGRGDDSPIAEFTPDEFAKYAAACAEMAGLIAQSTLVGV